jgi:hypothetical protein
MGEFSLYVRRNSTHRLGSCPNHRRSSVLGATSLAHRSMAAWDLRRPRGQRRSTRTRTPSSGDGGA